MKFFSYFLLFVSTFIFTQEALDLYSFSSIDHKERFYSLAEEISCPLCEGSSINGSTSPIAKDMKNIIFSMILENKSDDQIKSFFFSKINASLFFILIIAMLYHAKLGNETIVEDYVTSVNLKKITKFSISILTYLSMILTTISLLYIVTT